MVKSAAPDIDEISRYGAAVRHALRDLPAAAREDVTKDLDAHLEEVADEGGGGPTLIERLGQPEQYAVELRSSAGLPALAPTRTVVPSRTSRLMARVADDMTYTSTTLRPAVPPAWWFVRGVLAAVAFPSLAVILTLYVIDFTWFPIVAGVVAIIPFGATCPIASISLGRSTRPVVRIFNVLATILVLVMAALTAALLAFGW